MYDTCVENAVRRKRTLSNLKCSLKVSLGDNQFTEMNNADKIKDGRGHSRRSVVRRSVARRIERQPFNGSAQSSLSKMTIRKEQNGLSIPVMF